ncbi:MAG: Tim44 domain-containing protein [Rhodobacteraceae bacterium]|nr:Tim44 domain-containing protein [Paracoccaceae bacterium]
MSSSLIQILVLAGIAIFLVLRLKSVLGTRDGFEKPPLPMPGAAKPEDDVRPDFAVIDGGPDPDIIDNVPDGSDAAVALSAMKRVEPDFSVTDFLTGARGAYEMILMAFENGDLTDVEPFLTGEVRDSFNDVIDMRAREGLSIQASFVGVREIKLVDARYDAETSDAEMTVRFVAELTSVVRNAAGEIVEGDPNEIKRQRDVWTFARLMGADDPNWLLVATGE